MQIVDAPIEVIPELGYGRVSLAKIKGASIAEIPDSADWGFIVTGLTAAQIGDIPAAGSARLLELTPSQSTFEAAFLELTGDSVAYRGVEVAPVVVGERSAR